MNKSIGIIMALFAFSPVAQAMNVVYSGVMVSTNGNVTETSKASTQTYTMDVNNTGDVISAQLSYASSTLANSSFISGRVSTFTLTVVSTQGLVGIKATDTITVLSTNSLTNAIISINGVYKNNTGWRVNFASNTAVDIATALNGFLGFSASTATTTSVTVSCPNIGLYCNGQTMAIVGTSSITVSSPTFQGGRDAGYFTINGVTKSAGVDFSVGATAAITAQNIEDAIMADANLTAIVLSSAATGSAIIFTTSTAVGPGYTITTSTQSALTMGPYTSSSPVTGMATGTMVGGLSAAFTINTPIITIASHGLTTGYGVVYSTGSGVALTPLAFGTTYYAIRVDANNIKLATSQANALAGTAITLTSSNTKTTADSFTLTPQPITGSAYFALQGSNDGVNWNSVTPSEYGATISQVNFATPFTAASTLWDLGLYHHRYLRLYYAAPPTGGMAFTLTVNLKNNKI